jgi:hypothetical protein
VDSWPRAAVLAGYAEQHRGRTVAVNGQQVSVQDFLVSAWTLPENVRYAVIRQRHEEGLIGIRTAGVDRSNDSYPKESAQMEFDCHRLSNGNWRTGYYLQVRQMDVRAAQHPSQFARTPFPNCAALRRSIDSSVL